MKIMTLLGTRPEIIRLCRVIALLDERAEHVLVHTGQNYDDRLSRIFFEDLGVRQPDVYLGIQSSSMSRQIGEILASTEELILEHRPDRLLILGDTNSGLSALVAKRLGVPVYHMEAGNRCFDDRVPEEVNRRVIDHCSSIWMPYTYRSKENLLREGIAINKIYVVGNPIFEVMQHYQEKVRASTVLDTLGLLEKDYFLVTMHRAENVDVEERLKSLTTALLKLHEHYGKQVVCSLHPRTKNKMEHFCMDLEQSGIRYLEPFGFFDFLRLEESAFCVLSDSGTVQEETCIMGVPNVTIRDVTERPETVECGSNVLGGADPEEILGLVRMVVERGGGWRPPTEYLATDVSATVGNIVLGYRTPEPSDASWE